jgi:ribosome maturation factor RimP
MSGSSRHGSVRPPAAAGSRPGTGGRSGTGGRRGSGGRPGTSGTSGRAGTSGQGRAGGRPDPDGRPGAGTPDAEKIAALLEPVLSATGMDLEGVRVTAAGRRRLLRLIVDADGGVSLDDIARVSRDISAALDDAAVMGEMPYTLEVSSPGVDRPLTERRHWRRAIGRLVVVPLRTAPGSGARASSRPGGPAAQATVEGRIQGASGDGITLEIDGESRQFGYGDLGPGKIKIEFAPIDARADDDLDGADPGEGDPGGRGREDAGSGDEGADEEGPGGY